MVRGGEKKLKRRAVTADDLKTMLKPRRSQRGVVMSEGTSTANEVDMVKSRQPVTDSASGVHVRLKSSKNPKLQTRNKNVRSSPRLSRTANSEEMGSAYVGDVEDVKERLPSRLFATDRFSTERVNMYSTVDYLLAMRDALAGTPEWEVLLRSCFGGIFKIPARRLLMGRVVHGLMTRQLVTRKKYEMWPVFGGKPFRFSLVEFGDVTGLPCGEFEDGYIINYQIPSKPENYEYWSELIGPEMDVTIEDIVAIVESEKEMPGWRKLRLCLLIIVDEVLIATTQRPRPTLKYVKMLENLDNFLAFPWGRESFLWTPSTLKPPPRVLGKCEDPVGEFCKKLRQKTMKLVGFPLSLQLVAYASIPGLLKLVGGDDKTNLLNYRGKMLPQHSGLALADVQKAEHERGVMFLFCKKTNYSVTD